jgi:hypothetical protein
MQLVFYRDVFGGWRYEFRDDNGHLRDSPHSYDTARNASRLPGTPS